MKLCLYLVEKNNNYTVMANYHLRDKELSFKAKGLLSYMLSLPEDWDYSLNGLASVSKEGIKAVKNIIVELKEQGYLRINKIRKENGQYQYEYLIREIPEQIKPEYPKGYAVKGETEKGIQINTNKQNTKEQIDKEDKSKKSSFFNGLNSLTKVIIKENYISEHDIELFKYNNLFEELIKKYDYEVILKITWYIICHITSNKFLDEEGNLIENKFGYFKTSMLNNINKLISNEIKWNEDIGWFENEI